MSKKDKDEIEIIYNYSKLRGKMREKQFTEEQFAEIIGIHKATFSKKINNGSEFKQSEIINSIEALGLPVECIVPYFFCKATSEKQSLDERSNDYAN